MTKRPLSKAFIIISLFALLLLGFSTSGFSTIYYVNTAADAGGDGTTQELTGEHCAFKTIAQVNAASPAAGDSILFNKGDTWREQLTVPTSGSDGSPITFGAYGEGADPIINGVQDIAGWDTGGNWIADSSSETATYSSPDDQGALGGAAWVRTIIPTADFTASGTYIKLTIEARPGYDCTIIGTSIGERTTTTEDFADTPSRITWDTGSSSVTITGGNTKSSDAVEYDFDYTKNHLIHVQTSDGGFPKKNDYKDGVHYDIIGTDQTLVADVTADGTSSNFYACKAMEVTTPGVSNCWKIDCTYDPNRVFIDSTEYIEAEDKANIDSTYRWWYDSGNTDLYVYATENPSTAYETLQGSRVGIAAVISATDRDYITFQNLDVRGGNYAIDCYRCDYIIIDTCTLGLNSLTGIIILGNESDPYTPSTHGEIKDCTVWSGYNNSAADYATTGVHDGIGLVNGCQYWKVHDNDIRNWGHTGIACDINNTNLRSTQNEVYSNYISAPNTNYCRGMSMEGIAADKCDHNKFYYNYIEDTTASNSFQGNDSEYYYNIIDTVTDGGVQTAYDGLDMNCDDGATYVCTDNKIYNNIIYNTARYGIKMDGYTGTGDKQGNLFKNNIIMNWGDTYYGIFMEDHASVKDNTWQNNCVYKSGVSDVVYYGHDGADDYPHTIAEFNAENGTASDVIGSNISSDPLMTDPANGDFRLNPHSLCVNAGTDVSLTEDYEGLKIRHAPDIGAHENQTNVLFFSWFLRDFLGVNK